MRFVLAALLAVSNAFAQRPAASIYQFIEEKDGHYAKLIFKTRAFDASQHKILYSDPDRPREHRTSPAPGFGVSRIDGKPPLGVDGELPTLEIASLTFFIDGKRVAVPKTLYNDCFLPNFRKDTFAVKFSDDAETVFVFMHGGDGAGVYDVIWVLAANGQHTRLTSRSGDCNMLDFYCGLQKN